MLGIHEKFHNKWFLKEEDTTNAVVLQLEQKQKEDKQVRLHVWKVVLYPTCNLHEFVKGDGSRT